MKLPLAGRAVGVAASLCLQLGCDDAPKTPTSAPSAQATSSAVSSPSAASTARAPSEPQATTEKLSEPPSSIAAQHILIEYRGAERAEKTIKRSKPQARELAESVRAKALSGADFSKLVSEYSEDPGAKERLGSLGKFTREKMHKNFSDAAFKLKLNEISDVVETPFGFHVIKRNQ